MKRLTILACAALILLAAAGCGNTDSTDDSTDSSAESIIIQEDSSRDIPVPAPDSIIGPISISESEQPHEHIWEPASCETPKTCSVCGTTEGKPAGHKWIAATCTEKRICEVCSKQAGEPLGHDWSRATLSSPKTCKRCGITEGQPLNYTYYVDGFVNTKTDPLSIRTVPDGNGEVIAEIPRDSLIRIYKCGLEDWFYTTYNGSEGYIRSMYVTLRDSFYTSRQYYGRMRVNTLSDPLALAVVRKYSVFPLIAMTACLPIVPLFRKRFSGQWTEVVSYAAATVLLLLSLIFLIGQSYNPFIYFRF